MSTRAWAGGGIAAVLTIGLVLAVSTAAFGQDAAAPAAGGPAHTITVSSTATTSTPPDEAVITFSVHTDNADSVAALNEEARIVNDLLAAMKSLGIVERDMETKNISLSPQTLNRGTSSETTVYNASTTLEVTLHDFADIGTAIEKGVAAGATSVRGVRFQVADPAGAKARALAAAVESARAKADALAGAAGAKVTGVVQIREENAGGGIPRPYYAKNATYGFVANALSVVAPKSIDAEVSITVIWSIG